VLQRIGLAATVEVEVTAPAFGVVVEGFEDTIVRAALGAFEAATGVERGWYVRIDKRIPVAAGLGGGSADAGAALLRANELSGGALSDVELHDVAATVGSDVPFFLRTGPQLAEGDGSELTPLALEPAAAVVVVLPHDVRKESTAAIYTRFDERSGATGFEDRRAAMRSTLERATTFADLATLPVNDLASSSLADDLRRAGAVLADVSGAGPAVFGLFEDEAAAGLAARELRAKGRVWLTQTVEAP
jgi:4-diphosphocytidyl-2-C-methyl-D-erythritol kinase